MDLKNIFNDVLFSAAVETIKDLIDAAVKSGANLTRANLYGANLYGANLDGANLYGAQNIPVVVAARTNILPEGSFIGWKQCKNNVIVRLLITHNVRRSNATGRKCRAESVRVLEVFGASEGLSIHDGVTTYRKGETVICDSWNEHRWVECGGGIHFYLSRVEAENN